jgi:hypothetical protein
MSVWHIRSDQAGQAMVDFSLVPLCPFISMTPVAAIQCLVADCL